MLTNVTHLNYTPVTKETFSKWCTEFLQELKIRQEAERTEMDDRKTGKEIFMEAAADFEDLTLENEEESGEPIDYQGEDIINSTSK